MSAAPATRNAVVNETPLEQLSALLTEDMRDVNALILRNLQSQVPLIPQVGAWLIAAGGKRIRPLLTLAAARMYGCTDKRPLGLATAVEFIHTATLLHDDVVDESVARRGRDSANVVFGNQASVLVGDFLFSRAFELMVECKNLDVLRILSHASAIIAEGEVMQLTTTSNLATTFEEYEQVVRGKTAALFAAACEIGPLIAGADTSAAAPLAEYGMNLGIAFQIADDVLDYSSSREQIGKTAGDDFREGKMTAPVILALQDANTDERAFWLRTLAERKQDPSDFVAALDILRRRGSLDKGLALARDYAVKAQAALAEAPDGDLRGLLNELALFAVERVS